MPRKSKIDAPGALHHIIARGIDCKNIFLEMAIPTGARKKTGRLPKYTHKE